MKIKYYPFSCWKVTCILYYGCRKFAFVRYYVEYFDDASVIYNRLVKFYTNSGVCVSLSISRYQSAHPLNLNCVSINSNYRGKWESWNLPL